MTSLLNALSSFAFTNSDAPSRAVDEVSELEYQSVFAATAVLLGGGIAVTLTALSQAF